MNDRVSDINNLWFLISGNNKIKEMKILINQM